MAPSRFYTRAFALGTIAVLGSLLFRTLTPFVVPIICMRVISLCPLCLTNHS